MSPSTSSDAARRLRIKLMERLRADGIITSEPVAAAFAAVPREGFIPEVLAREGLEGVYRDEAFVTKRNARGMPLSSSSQPAIMAKMLELLDLRPGQRVLEVGAGTGYNAALLSHLVGPSGRVTSVDIDPQLARSARRAIRDAGYRATVAVADGRRDSPRRGPFDRVIVTACADEIPRIWREQLTEGGRLVLPLRLDPDGAAIQLIPALERRGTRLHLVALTWGGFMPLHGGDGGWRAPDATLSAGRVRSGEQSPLASLSGAGLARLSDAAARALLASMLTLPTAPLAHGMTSHMAGMDAPVLLIYLLLKIPPTRRISVHASGRLGVGVVDPRAGGVAVVSVRTPWTMRQQPRRRRTRWRLDAYGPGRAASELEGLLEQWEQMREARRDRLRLTAYGEGEVLRLRFGWSAQDARSD